MRTHCLAREVNTGLVRRQLADPLKTDAATTKVPRDEEDVRLAASNDFSL
jgi:hypothetical protein